MFLRVVFFTIGIFAASTVTLAEPDASNASARLSTQYSIEESSIIARVPAGFPVGFSLLTHDDTQYAAYYDEDHRMTVASRKIDLDRKFGSEEWTYQPLDSKVGWDSHNYITMAIDSDGQLHVAGNMHNVPLVYFRTQKVGDIRTLTRQPMTGERESRVTYPRFITDPQGRLIFNYRDGGSGNGSTLYNVYDVQSQSWTRLFDQPLFDGQGRNNAYPYGPKMFSDGLFRVAWVWRESPDCETNHHLSYAQSRDLVNWQNAAGEPVELPLTLDDESLNVDPIPVEGGIINGCQRIFLDSENRPIVSYHKLDDAGNMQIFLARFEAGDWVARAVTDWDKPIHFSGRGSMPFIGIRIGNLRRVKPGILAINYRHKDFGSGNVFIDEATLEPSSETVTLRAPFPRELGEVQSDFDGVSIRRAHDMGDPGEPGVRYMLQWETLPTHHDKQPEPPLPQPSELRLIKLKRVAD